VSRFPESLSSSFWPRPRRRRAGPAQRSPCRTPGREYPWLGSTSYRHLPGQQAGGRQPNSFVSWQVLRAGSNSPVSPRILPCLAWEFTTVPPNHLIDSPDRNVYTYPVPDTNAPAYEKTMNRTKKTGRGRRSRAVQVAGMAGSSCRIVIIKDGQFVHAQAKRPALKVTASR